jgi:restriction endonuclease S subunit
MLRIDKEAWETFSLGELVQHSRRTVDPASGEVSRYVAGEHMETDQLEISKWGEIGDGYLGPAFIRRFSVGEVLYGSRRTYLRKLAVADFDGVCSNTTLVLNTKSQEVLLQDFLPFIMSTESFHAFSIRESKGSVNPYVNWTDLAKFEVLLPPVSMQKEIANLLWRFEDLKRKSYIKLYWTKALQTEIAKHVFRGLAGQESSGKTLVSDLGKVAIVRKGETITNKTVKPGSIPVVAGGMKAAYFHDASNRKGQSLTISASGANAGFVNSWDIPIWASDCTTIQVAEKTDLIFEFIHMYLLANQDYIYQRLRKGSAQPHVYSSDLEKLRIPVPAIEIQSSIVKRNLEISNALINIEEEIEVQNKLFRKILQEMIG